MPVKFEILEDGWVARYTFEKPWTTAECTAHYPEDNAHRSRVNHTVYLLLDLHLSAQLPPPDIFRAQTNAPVLLYPDSSEMIVSAASPLESRIAETIFKIVRLKNIKFFDTNEAAWEYIRRQIAEEKQAMSNPEIDNFRMNDNQG